MQIILPVVGNFPMIKIGYLANNSQSQSISGKRSSSFGKPFKNGIRIQRFWFARIFYGEFIVLKPDEDLAVFMIVADGIQHQVT